VGIVAARPLRRDPLGGANFWGRLLLDPGAHVRCLRKRASGALTSPKRGCRSSGGLDDGPSSPLGPARELAVRLVRRARGRGLLHAGRRSRRMGARMGIGRVL